MPPWISGGFLEKAPGGILDGTSSRISAETSGIIPEVTSEQKLDKPLVESQMTPREALEKF